MVDTSIKVDELVRDRLALLAREAGTTIRELVAELAAARLTAAELDARYAGAHTRITAHLCPELTAADTAAGQWVWDELRAGRLPASLTPPGHGLARAQGADTAPGGQQPARPAVRPGPAHGTPGQGGESRRAG